MKNTNSLQTFAQSHDLTTSPDTKLIMHNRCLDINARLWAIDVQGEWIASVSEDNSCRIWNLDGFSKSVWSVALNKTCEFVALGSNDGSVTVHNLTRESETLLSDYVIPEVWGSITNSITTPDGTCYASTDSGNVVKLQSDCFMYSDR